MNAMRLLALFTAAVVAACAAPVRDPIDLETGAPAAAVRELAATGKLRAGMNLGNALFTTKDSSGAIQGVSVDVMRELGRRLGVPVEFVVHETPGDVADAVDRNTWDVAILAIEASRAEKIAFSRPMTEIEATYAVKKESLLRSADDVDRPGVRIAAAEKAGYELYLRRALRNATLVSTKGSAAALEALNRGDADALAALKPALLEGAPRTPHLRILEGRFMTVNHGLATPRTRPAAAAYLDAFAKEMIESGFIARSIERHAVQGLRPVR